MRCLEHSPFHVRAQCIAAAGQPARAAPALRVVALLAQQAVQLGGRHAAAGLARGRRRGRRRRRRTLRVQLRLQRLPAARAPRRATGLPCACP